MVLAILLLFLLIHHSEANPSELSALDFLQKYEIRRILGVGTAHVDVYGRNTLAISWYRDGEVSGYLFNTKERTTDWEYAKFAERVCLPYTVVKWGQGCPPGVLAAPCDSQWYWRDNITLTFGRDQFLTNIVDDLSIIRFDPIRAVIYGYEARSGNLRRYDGKSFQRLESLHVGTIEDFHVGDGKVFVRAGGNITVYDDHGAHTQIFKRPDNESEDVSVYYVYNSSHSCCGFPLLVYAFIHTTIWLHMAKLVSH
jgi:hypothetical protein